MEPIHPISASEARALSDEPWYMKKIREAANKNFYEVALECISMQEASNLSTVLADLGYTTYIGKQTMFYGPAIHLMVSW